MNKYIMTLSVRNETVAFLVVKPFYSTFHDYTSIKIIKSCNL